MTKILIADDIPENLYLLETILKANGFTVISASNGAEALDLGRKDPPDLVITDILMPIMDGFELCRRWKADDVLKHAPFVFYTATYTDTKDEQFALSIGAERFIVKPQQPEVLIKIVQDILDEFNKGKLVPVEKPLTEEMDFMHRHNEVLLRKLEKKTLQLEREITERRQAEQQLRDHEELLDNAHEAIIRADLEDRIIYWNKGSERLYGWKAEEIVGKITHETISKEDLAQVQSAIKTVKEKGKWRGEMRHIDRNGKRIVVDSSWTLTQDEAGKPESILVIDSDITEKKKLETQFLRAQRLESIGTLASGIAHDLINVLTPIILSVENLRIKYSNEQSQELLNMIERNAKRGTDLIKRVLLFARGLEEEHKNIVITDIITDVDTLVKETFPRSIEIRVKIPADIWTISGDATQLHQVLMNLCVNARDAMPEGGVLTISAENVLVDENYAKKHIDAKVGPYVVITVADTGIGMTPEIQERLFEPFFTTKELGKGSGLGLSTALGILKGHGGFINVESEVGKGTSFRVHIPAIKVPAKPNEGPRLDIPGGHGEVILVADDEESTRKMASSILKANGYEVLEGRNGAEAISIFAQNKDRVIMGIIALMMPIIDGMEAIRLIQRINPDVKIIAVSRLKANKKLITPANKNVKTFLLKPCKAETLLTAIHDALSS
nr:response regulator [Candidatus Sigynarchaeota archaeon]